MTAPASGQGMAEVMAWAQAVDAEYNRVVAAKGSAAADITVEQLRDVMPKLSQAEAEKYLPLLNAAMAKYEINNPMRQAAFLSQLAVESTELTDFVENASGKAYEGNVKNLGNTEPGDGPRFKGRGPIQLTGRDNYTRAGKALDLPLVSNPDLAADPQHGFDIAGWFWDSKNVNEDADRGDFEEVSRTVNGGLNGYEARKEYYDEAKRVLGA